jgi:hypothetical protein
MTINTGPIKSILQGVGDLLGMLIPILITIALIVFFWGLIQFFYGGGKDTSKGRKVMMAGIIGLFVMISIWGIIVLVQEALGVDKNAKPQVPQIPTSTVDTRTGTGAF